ncbi:MAG TPA: acyltransferase [Ohtaekwangia sp.]
MVDTLNSREHLYKVDILRGIAILAVFVFHCQVALYPQYVVESYQAGRLNVNSVSDFLLYFSPSAFGWTGVELFLLISGFLIHFGYLANPDRFNLRTFYSKRFWRIYPPYFLVLVFLCLTGAGLTFYVSTKEGILDFGLHALLLHNLLDRTFFSINTSFWSLALEAQLYLIYPVFLLIRKYAGIQKTFFLTLVISLILYVIGSFGIYLNGWNSYSFFIIKTWYMWAAGAYLAEWYYTGRGLFNKSALLWGVLFFFALCMSKYFSVTKHFQPYCATFLWLAFFEWTIQSSVFRADRFLMKVLTVIGLCSYSIYLIHQPMIEWMFSYLDFNTIDSDLARYGGMLLALLAAFGIIFLISYALYRFIELKSIAIGNNLRSRR